VGLWLGDGTGAVQGEGESKSKSKSKSGKRKGCTGEMLIKVTKSCPDFADGRRKLKAPFPTMFLES